MRSPLERWPLWGRRCKCSRVSARWLEATGRTVVAVLVLGLGGCDRQATNATVPVIVPLAASSPAPSATGSGSTAAPSVASVSLPKAATEPEKEEPPWACDIGKKPTEELVIYKRRADGGWTKIRPSAGPGNPPARGAYYTLLSKGLPHHVCSFVDAQHAWVAALYEDEGTRIFGTADGGRTWTVSTVMEAYEYDHLELRFRDAKHGKVAEVTGGGHGNGHVETLKFYTTSDGGRTWRRLSRRCRYDDETKLWPCLEAE